MTSEQEDRVEQLFHAARGLALAERDGFLAQACAGDEALWREVERLLRADGGAADFLAAPVWAALTGDELAVSDLSGRRLGHYQILSLLGRGGMGEVYLARDEQLERRAALKLLPAEYVRDTERLRRFEREAKAASALNHPNILTIYEFGAAETEAGLMHFIASEFVDGQTLRELLVNERLSLIAAVEMATQIASALAAAHEAGIIHRDIKPENVMLRRDGLIKVLDFGLAKLNEQQPEAIDSRAPTKGKVLTGQGAVMGTASYMSPEQARGQEVDARSDIFSFGVMLYEMVAGRAPFNGSNSLEVISEILKTEPAPLAQHIVDVPPEIQLIVTRALRKDRQQRYQQINDLLLDLKDLKQQLEFAAKWPGAPTMQFRDHGQAASAELRTNEAAVASTNPTQAVQTTSSAEYLIGEIKRHRLGAALLLALLLGAAAISGYFFQTAHDAPAAIRAVAVLPFANGSGDQNLDYLSDGLSESLLDRLSQLPQLKVIARGSAFKYKGREAEPQQVGEALGVQAFITGRVELRDDSLKVHAELVDARDGTQMWGQRFERRAGDLQAIQETIAQEVAGQLRQRQSDLATLPSRAPVSRDAYEMLLRGRAAFRKFTPESVRRAAEFYQQAVSLDPGYALAHAELADVYRMMGGLSEDDQFGPQQAMARAEASVAQALKLDARLAEAHRAQAELERDRWNWPQSERAYQRALELNPNLAEAREGYALYLSVMGRHEQALAEMQRARELDPLRLPTNISLAALHYNARRYEEALAVIGKILELEPDAGPAHAWSGIVRAAQGDYPQAIAEYQRAIKLGDDKTDTQGYLGYALAMAGRRAEAQAMLERLRKSKAFVSPVTLALIYTGLGRREEALAGLEQAYAARDASLQYLNVEPHFDPIYNDARFQRLLRNIGLKP